MNSERLTSTLITKLLLMFLFLVLNVNEANVFFYNLSITHDMHSIKKILKRMTITSLYFYNPKCFQCIEITPTTCISKINVLDSFKGLICMLCWPP